jgi:hypothetical protein
MRMKIKGPGLVVWYMSKRYERVRERKGELYGIILFHLPYTFTVFFKKMRIKFKLIRKVFQIVEKRENNY